MSADPAELARKLARIQARLRRELLEELQEHGDDLEGIFDPYSYSPLVHELRDKYLSRLYLIHGILQQLAHHGQARNKHATRVMTLGAESQRKLVHLVNRKLGKLNGAKVLDIKFIPGSESADWSALITYQVNPFLAEADGTAAWM